MIRYDAMKCGMLIVAASHACAPAPMSTRSERPLSNRGTKTISDSPPTHSTSTTGLMIDAARGGARGACEALGSASREREEVLLMAHQVNVKGRQASA